ncbi:hypothetical protein A5727_20810 [Mycobacterium sp. ACS4331]|nr:hypothetical protein A5727_20810 [Mycobacterium sp. ACS4331]
MVITAVLGTAAGFVAVASAAPEADPVLCQYTLSEPRVVDVSGTAMVNASLTPSGCTGSAEPNATQVCVSVAGSSTAGKCAELPGYGTAQVYLSPYVPGQTYTVRGRGCANQAQPPLYFCSTLGPKSATL